MADIRDDSAGNYGTWSNPQDQSWLDWLKMKAADVQEGGHNAQSNILSALSPYGDEGWQVPPAVHEPVNALSRLFGSGNFAQGPDYPGNADDMRTLLFSMYGGNALNPTGLLETSGIRDAAQAVYRSARYPGETVISGRPAGELTNDAFNWPPLSTYGVKRQDRAGYDFYDAYEPTRASRAMPHPASMEPTLANDATQLAPSDMGYMNALLAQERRSELSVIPGDLLSDTGKPSLMGSALAGADAPHSLDIGRMLEAQAANPNEMNSLFADLRTRGMLHSDTPMPRRTPDVAMDTWNQDRQFENTFAQTPLQPGGAMHATYPDDPSRFLSRFNHNGKIYEAEGSLGPDNTALVDWIGPENLPPEMLYDKGNGSNTVGRGALRAWKNSFLEQFPDVKSFSGERISGARAVHDVDPMQTVNALFSDTGHPSLFGSALYPDNNEPRNKLFPY